jgi:hypothetical protein
MTRKLLAAALALLAAACGGPAPEDMTAHYSKTGGQPFAVEAAANGDARVVVGDETWLRIGGVDYLVMKDARGSFVARGDDLIALLTEAPESPRPQPDYATTDGGGESVAGLPGKVWKIHPKDTPSLVTVDAVVSGDRALAGVGKGLAAYTRTLIVRNGRAMGAPGNLEKAMIALLDKGAVLRFGTVMRLERIDKAPLKGVLTLPARALDREALRVRLATPDPVTGSAML